jgi:hypothetical protein
VADDAEKITTDFGRRLHAAIVAAKTTQSAVGRELGLTGARMPRLLGKGPSPIRAPEPETIRQLADHLGVSYEWLALGRGPMKPGDSWSVSGFAAAVGVASASGVDRETIDATAARYRDASLTPSEWVVAFGLEAGLRRRAEHAARETVRRAEQTRAEKRAVRAPSADEPVRRRRA